MLSSMPEINKHMKSKTFQPCGFHEVAEQALDEAVLPLRTEDSNK